MTRKVLLTTAITALAFITLTSNRTGPANNGNGNKTGGPGSAGQTCAMSGCHNSGIGTTTGIIEVRKRFKPDSNAIVNAYLPDSMYTIKLTGTHSFLTRFGFQLEAIKIKDSTNAGTFSSLAPKMQSKVVGGITLLEHTDTISTGSLSLTFAWKAPAKNSGQIRFYAMVNAVNGDNTNNNDQPSSPVMFALSESLNIAYAGNENKISIYPNPVSDKLNIQQATAANGSYQLRIVNTSGQVIASNSITINNNTLDYSMNTSVFTCGLYMLYITHNDQQQVVPFIKQ